jgi:5'-nucleotidase
VAGGTLLAAAPGFAMGGLKRGARRITILHTNDMHSRIDPFPASDPRYAGLGGMEKRSALIKKVRSQEDHVLLLDAGDIFQGTPYFNMYGGELEFKLMTEMGYDAATMGNHDFDNGLEGFNRMLPHAGFPFICSNYNFSDTILNGKTHPCKVFRKGDINIGVFGLGVELEGLVGKSNYGETRYEDPIATANKTAQLLKYDQNCHLVIALSHLGYSYEKKKVSDVVLAAETENIDLIIGGHTHTFLDEATRLKNKKGTEVLVTQAGWAGICVGRVDFVLEETGAKQSITSALYPLNNGASTKS